MVFLPMNWRTVMYLPSPPPRFVCASMMWPSMSNCARMRSPAFVLRKGTRWSNGHHHDHDHDHEPPKIKGSCEPSIVTKTHYLENFGCKSHGIPSIVCVFQCLKQTTLLSMKQIASKKRKSWGLVTSEVMWKKYALSAWRSYSRLRHLGAWSAKKKSNSKSEWSILQSSYHTSNHESNFWRWLDKPQQFIHKNAVPWVFGSTLWYCVISHPNFPRFKVLISGCLVPATKPMCCFYFRR